MTVLTPTNQTISINSSDGRIFDFNTSSSRVYLGETINSLLKPFGKSCVLTGFNIKTLEYIESNSESSSDIVRVTLNPGEMIIDTTFIKYVEDNSIDIEVSSFDDKNGFLVLSTMFNYVTISSKNFSKLMLTYVTNDGCVPNRVWYNDCQNIILHKIYFDKTKKSVRAKINDIINKNYILIENVKYELYPLDNISKRIALMMNSYFS